MNKGDLVARVAKDVGITKVQSEQVLNAVLSKITSALKKGQKATLVGFGTFSVTRRRARIGRNPRTNEPIKIAARKVPKFTPGSDLKKAVR